MRTRLTLVVLAALVVAAFAAAPAAQAAKCDPIDPRACLLPWPNDYFTKVDKSMPTGRRLDLKAANLPKNNAGQPIDASAFAGNDGFSPGAQIMTQVPGLDLAKTGATSLTNLSTYTKKSAPILVIDASTKKLKRWPVWAEMNSLAETASDASLDVHPATNWQEGHRYIVVLRNLKNASGGTIKPNAAFKKFIAGKAKGSRAKHYKAIFKTLKKAKISTKGLYLSWDFTVASEKSLSNRFLTMRDDAFKQLGDKNLADGKIPAGSKAPAYTITKVQTFTHCASANNCADGQDDNIARHIEGTFDVPCYLVKAGKGDCSAGASMNYKSTKKGLWVPKQAPGAVYKAQFACNIPWVALSSPGSARPSLYGHGLLGDIGELNQGQLKKMSQEHDMVFCATPEIGMSSGDVGNAVSILQNFSTFNTFPDRLQQGMLDGLLLGRLLIHPKGLTANANFQVGGKSVVNTSHLYYDGNSQGGIFGGALTAVAPDFTRSVLGVVGMNYSLLVWRSTDFSEYLTVATAKYPDPLDRELIINVMQTLWDRGEGDGYAEHMTDDPYPNTPKHQVLMHIAVGDHQVSNFAAEVEARTIGAKGWKPGGTPFNPGRSIEKVPFWGIPAVKNGDKGSVIVAWDSGPKHTTGSDATQNLRIFGTDPSPLGNFPLVSSDDGHIAGDDEPHPGTYVPGKVGNGRDPHELPRNTPAARVQKSNFLMPNGTFTDQCGGKPCLSVQDY
jgi:hypothetical protein